MDDNFVFRGGKHNGKTYGWVRLNEPSYITWCKEKAPFMLKTKAEPKPQPEIKKEIKFSDGPIASIQPNLNFWNEGPEDISLPYLKKMEEAKKDFDFPF